MCPVSRRPSYKEEHASRIASLQDYYISTISEYTSPYHSRFYQNACPFNPFRTPIADESRHLQRNRHHRGCRPTKAPNPTPHRRHRQGAPHKHLRNGPAHHARPCSNLRARTYPRARRRRGRRRSRARRVQSSGRRLRVDLMHLRVRDVQALSSGHDVPLHHWRMDPGPYD